MTLRALLLLLVVLPSCAAQQTVHPGGYVRFDVTLSRRDARKAMFVEMYADCGRGLDGLLWSSQESHTLGSRQYEAQFYVPPGWPAGGCELTWGVAKDAKGRWLAVYALKPAKFNVLQP